MRVDQLGDLLALMGDTSDNIPGVPSVGPKTAKEFLVEYQNLDGLYAHVDQIKRKAAREALITHKDSAYISRRLVELKADCPLDFDLEKLRYEGKDAARLKELYAELGFLQKLALIEKEIAEAAHGGAASPAASGRRNRRPRSRWSRRPSIAPSRSSPSSRSSPPRPSTRAASPSRSRSICRTRTAGAWSGLGLALEPGRGLYVPIAHRYIGVPKQFPQAEVARVLGRLLSAREIKKAGLDLKAAGVALDRAGITLEGYEFDAKLASYLLDPEARHDREALAQRELGIAATAFDELTKKGRGPRLGFDEIPVEEATEYAAASADFALRLAERLRPRLAESGLEKLYDEVELPLARLLAELERRGVLVDTEVLSSLGADCEAELTRLEKEAHRIVGRAFNVNSPRSSRPSCSTSSG